MGANRLPSIQGIRRGIGRAQRKRTASSTAAVVVLALLLSVLPFAPSASAHSGHAIPVLPVASPTPSPSDSPSSSPSPSAAPDGETPPDGASIAWLNPTEAYIATASNAALQEYPSISDRAHGTHATYHLLAGANEPPPNAIVEATIRYPNENERTIGMLDRVEGTNVWELDWEIPDSLATGNPTLIVRMYGFTTEDVVEVDNDELVVSMRHKQPPVPTADPAPDDALEIVFPTAGGPLGFYRPRGGKWRAALNVQVSSSTAGANIYYSKTPLGAQPKLRACGTQVLTASSTTFDFDVTCTLQGSDVPSQVTAVAAIAQSSDIGIPPLAIGLDAGDVHAITPYIQDPADFQLKLTSWARALIGDQVACVQYTATVTDGFGKPVQGANLDVHAQGPDDQIVFGPASGNKAPDEGGHAQVPGTKCGQTIDENGAVAESGSLGKHRVPGGPDIVHRESPLTGTGASGPTGTTGVRAGQWRFAVSSLSPGFTDITVWVDDPSLPTETAEPPLDSDSLDPGEAFSTARAQWLQFTPKVTLDPPGATLVAGECTPVVMRARSGRASIPGVNVDVHATGPTDDLRFCELPDSGTTHAPDSGPASNAGPHSGVDEHQASHDGVANPQSGAVGAMTLHTEGQTDDTGNLVIGLLSPTGGDSNVVAWIDGETGTDNDILGPGEASGTASFSWTASIADADIGFLTPSGYGSNGDKISFKLDDDQRFPILVRADLADAPGVQLQVNSGAAGAFVTLGEATRVGTTDTYRYLLRPGELGTGRKLRAYITGTSIFEERTISVSPTADDPSTVDDDTFESATIRTPADGSIASFVRGSLKVAGAASGGAEGIDLFYTKTSAKDTPLATDWVACGYVGLSGGATSPQVFEGGCALQGADQPHQVTGIAAITYDCTLSGCDAAPPGPSADPNIPQTPRALGMRDSGDAHRVFGFDANPFLSIEPAEAADYINECHQLTAVLLDQTGQPVGGQNVDLSLTGPGEDATFCSSEPALGPQTYLEGWTNAAGRITFGVRSKVAGDTNITAWLDHTDDDLMGPGETFDSTLMHWTIPEGCDIVGTSGDDVLVGTPGPDRICGLGGNDQISGGGGNDIIHGGEGDDTLSGGQGQDLLVGEAGADIYNGGRDRDRCRTSEEEIAQHCER